MNTNKLFFSLAVATLGLCSIPNAAKAVTFTPLTLTDTEFNQMRATGEFTEVFVAESRVGDRGSAGQREVGINDAAGTPVTPFSGAGQYNWINGTPVDFILEYTGNLVKYVVGGQEVSTNMFSGPVTDIFLRTRAAANSTMSLSNLWFNGSPLANLVSSTMGSAATSDVDYLQISGINSPFRLTGTSIMAWTGTAPRNSNLAYQIKVGTTPQTDVPEPGTALALTFGAGALGLMKRKKASQESA